MRLLGIFSIAVEVGLDILCTEGEECRTDIEGGLELLSYGICIDGIDLRLTFVQAKEASLCYLDAIIMAVSGNVLLLPIIISRLSDGSSIFSAVSISVG